MKQILLFALLLLPALGWGQFITTHLIVENDTLQTSDPGTTRSPWRYSRADSTLYRWNYTTLAWEDWAATFGGGDGWGSDVVNTNSTLAGDGTVGNLLSADTSKIATVSALRDTSAAVRLDFPVPFSGAYGDLSGVPADIDEDNTDDATGSGTANNIPLWTAVQTLGDSYLSQNADGILFDAGKYLSLGSWTTAGQPTAGINRIGWNTTDTIPEWNDGTNWWRPAKTTEASFTQNYFLRGGPNGGLVTDLGFYRSGGANPIYRTAGTKYVEFGTPNPINEAIVTVQGNALIELHATPSNATITLLPSSESTQYAELIQARVNSGVAAHPFFQNTWQNALGVIAAPDRIYYLRDNTLSFELGTLFAVSPVRRVSAFNTDLVVGVPGLNDRDLDVTGTTRLRTLADDETAPFYVLTDSLGNTYRAPRAIPVEGLAPSTGSQTVDLGSKPGGVFQVNCASAGSPLTLTVNSPVDGGVYTFHFQNVTSQDIVFPAAFLNADGTSMGTVSYTADDFTTCYYDGTNYYCK